MKLAAWRKQEGKTQEWLAAELECSQSYVSQIERSSGPIIPGPEIMERVFVVTDGAVEPNDWYDIPRWRRLLSATLGALARKAA